MKIQTNERRNYLQVREQVFCKFRKISRKTTTAEYYFNKITGLLKWDRVIKIGLIRITTGLLKQDPNQRFFPENSPFQNSREAIFIYFRTTASQLTDYSHSSCHTYMWGHGVGGDVASSELHVGNTRSQQCIDHLKTNNCNPKKF